MTKFDGLTPEQIEEREEFMAQMERRLCDDADRATIREQADRIKALEAERDHYRYALQNIVDDEPSGLECAREMQKCAQSALDGEGRDRFTREELGE